MPQHPEPQILKDWWNDPQRNSNPPKVCHICEHYDREGMCAQFRAEPPLDFAHAPGACDNWLELIPF